VTDTKTERRLKKAHITLMRNPKFALWSGIFMVGKCEVVPDSVCPTAMTNGRDVYYGQSFVDGLDERELHFVVLHEAMHKALRQLTVWRKLFEENARLANCAADYVINLMIMSFDPEESLVTLPKKNGEVFALYDLKYKGMNTKQVYDLLKQEQEKRKREGTDGQPGKPGKPGEPGGQPGGGGQESFDFHDWEGAKELSSEEKKELERELDQAIRQGEALHKKLNGKGAGNMSRELGDLLAPQVNWKDQLREFVKATCAAKDTSSWARPNRRYISQGIYMPSWQGETIGRVVVGADTSGSIGVKELNTFLSEVKSICDEVRPSHVDLLYWDSHVAGHETYEGSELEGLVASTRPKGGGGTDPACVEKYVEEKQLRPECVIVLTDGYTGGNWGGNWGGVPVLWVVAGNPGAMAPVGKTIHIND
jgi:predicted metal-dependent peptidase